LSDGINGTCTRAMDDFASSKTDRPNPETVWGAPQSSAPGKATTAEESKPATTAAGNMEF